MERSQREIALVYPNTREVGMSSLGFRLVHSLFASRPGIHCERAFCEPGLGKSRPLTVENRRGLADFDVIAFSVSYENDFAALAGALSTSGISPFRDERGPDSPLVIAGGSLVMMNPEPLAPLIDLFTIGEGEMLIPAFLDALGSAPDDSKWKTRLLGELGARDGFYIPSSDPPTATRTVRRIFLPALDDHVWEESQMLDARCHFGDVYLLELGRGCPRRCRFCVARAIYHPVRFRNPVSVDSELTRAAVKSESIGFLGASLSDCASLKDFLARAASLGVSLQTSSLRMDRLNDDLLEVLSSHGVRTLTTAPEAGSERMRNVIRKDLPQEKILEAARRIGRARFPHLKLYFMLGLPGERDEDVEQIADLTLRISREVKRGDANTRITLCLSPFVPKPWTPFQWAPFERPENLRRKFRIVAKEIRRNVRIKQGSIPASAYESLIARGDRQVGAALARAVVEQRPHASTMKEMGLSKEFYLHREKRGDEAFPWDFLDHGVSKSSLREEWMKAKKEASG